jgi:hypothetical protein
MGVPKVGGTDTNFKGGGGEPPKELSKEDVTKLIQALIDSLTKKKDDPEKADGAGGDKAGGAGGGGKPGDKVSPEETLELLQKLMSGEKLKPEEMKKLESATGMKAEDLEKVAGDGKDIK